MHWTDVSKHCTCLQKPLIITNDHLIFRSGASSSYKKSIGMMKLTSSMETSTRNLSRQTAYNDLTEESPTHSDCDDFSDTDSFIM